MALSTSSHQIAIERRGEWRVLTQSLCVTRVPCGGGARARACVALRRRGVQLRGAIQCVMFNYSGANEATPARFSNLHPINLISSSACSMKIKKLNMHSTGMISSNRGLFSFGDSFSTLFSSQHTPMFQSVFRTQQTQIESLSLLMLLQPKDDYFHCTLIARP